MEVRVIFTQEELESIRQRAEEMCSCREHDPKSYSRYRALADSCFLILAEWSDGPTLSKDFAGLWSER